VGQKIDQDLQRFRKIVREKVKSNLSKYLGKGEMIGKKGNDLVSIPLPQINLPQFRYGQKVSGGVGVGPGRGADEDGIAGHGNSPVKKPTGSCPWASRCLAAGGWKDGGALSRTLQRLWLLLPP